MLWFKIPDFIGSVGEHWSEYPRLGLTDLKFVIAKLYFALWVFVFKGFSLALETNCFVIDSRSLGLGSAEEAGSWVSGDKRVGGPVVLSSFHYLSMLMVLTTLSSFLPLM